MAAEAFRSIDRVALIWSIATATATLAFTSIFKPMPAHVFRAPRHFKGFLPWLLDQAYDRSFLPPMDSDAIIFEKSKYKAVTYRHFCFQIIAIAHPLDVEHVFMTNKSNYVKGMGYSAFKRMFGEGLVTILDDDEHAAHRRMVSPAFSPQALNQMSKETMVVHAMELFNILNDIVRKEGGAAIVPLQDLISRAALHIVADAAFHTGKEELDGISSSIMRLQENGISFLSFIPGFDQLPSKSYTLLHAFRSMVNEIVLRRFQAREEQGTGEGRAIIDYLVKSKLSFTQLKDHSVTFMFAGFETSSTTLQWTLLAIARDQQIQQKLFDELASALGRGMCPDVDVVRSCLYLKNVIRESLRLFSPVVGLPRKNLHDDVLPYSKTVIPAGSYIDVAFAATHVEPSTYGPDPKVFRPERWEDPTLEQRVGSCGFIPFSAGPRNCIGQDFAWNEIMLLLSLLVRNFTFAFPPGENFPEQKRGIVIYPAPFRLITTSRVV